MSPGNQATSYFLIDPAKFVAARRAALLSLNGLARLAGVSRDTLADIEHGRYKWGQQPATLRIIADALGVTPHSLLTSSAPSPMEDMRPPPGVGAERGGSEHGEGVDFVRNGSRQDLDLGVAVDLGVQPLSTEDSQPNTLARRKVGRVEPNGFAEWYAAYPLHVGRGQAALAYRRALKFTDHLTLYTAVQAFARDPNLPEDRSKIPYPATWLNGRRWEDEPLPARSNGHLSEIEKFRLAEGISRGQG